VPVLLLGMLASAPRAAESVRALLRNAPLPVVCNYQGAGVVPVGFDPIEYDPERNVVTNDVPWFVHPL
jgi:hypothetical protein